jgi:hypothetical protein
MVKVQHRCQVGVSNPLSQLVQQHDQISSGEPYKLAPFVAEPTKERQWTHAACPRYVTIFVVWCQIEAWRRMLDLLEERTRQKMI